MLLVGSIVCLTVVLANMPMALKNWVVSKENQKFHPPFLGGPALKRTRPDGLGGIANDFPD